MLWEVERAVCVAAVLLVCVACTKQNPYYCDESTPCELPDAPYCDLQGEYGPNHTCTQPPAGPDAGDLDAAATGDASGTPGLSVLKDGAGAGTVVSEPAGIVCGSTCMAGFDRGTAVVLSALADEGSVFSGWSAPECSDLGPCSLAIDEATTVTASFELEQHSLVVSRSGDGDGTVTANAGAIDCGATCSDEYSHGSMVEVTATSIGASVFAGWSGDCAGTAVTCSLDMDAAKSVGAAFDLDRRSLSVSLAGAGGGTVTSDVGNIDCPGGCSDSYVAGTTVTLSAAADATSIFAGWSGACTGMSGTCTVTMDAARSVTATFEPQLVSLTVATSGTGGGLVASDVGLISCPGVCSDDFVVGTVVTLAATPDAASTFESWSGACTGTGGCTVTLDTAKTVTAVFDVLSPPVIDGQSADLVLGQSDFAGKDANSGGETAGSLNFPSGAASDGTFLWVGDSLNGRVLQWNSLPIVIKAGADRVIGQGGYTTHTSATTQTNMRAASSGVRAFSDGTRLFVSDNSSHRVLIWNAVPTSNGQPADVVVGQTSFTSNSPGKGADQLYYPEGLWSDGTRLIVADTTNSRVLIWNAIPTSNGQPADVVLGRSGFDIGYGDAVASPPTASSMNRPEDVYYDGAHLFVVDTTNNRVLAWEGIPSTNGAPADFVLGQGAFGGSSPDAGGGSANAVGLAAPSGVTAAFGSLFVTDTGNHRVVVYTPVPTSSGTAASAVLGQDNLTTGSLAASAAANRMSRPEGIAVMSDKLFVTDNAWSRALRFDLNP